MEGLAMFQNKKKAHIPVLKEHIPTIDFKAILCRTFHHSTSSFLWRGYIFVNSTSKSELVM